MAHHDGIPAFTPAICHQQEIMVLGWFLTSCQTTKEAKSLLTL
jgi:hypothetical protein